MVSWCDTGQNQRRPNESKLRAKILPRNPCRRLALVTLLSVLISSTLCCTPSKTPMRHRQFNTRPLSGRWFTTATLITSSNTNPILLLNMHDNTPLKPRPPTRLPPSRPISRATIHHLRTMLEHLINLLLNVHLNRPSDRRHHSTHRPSLQSLARTQ